MAVVRHEERAYSNANEREDKIREWRERKADLVEDEFKDEASHPSIYPPRILLCYYSGSGEIIEITDNARPPYGIT